MNGNAQHEQVARFPLELPIFPAPHHYWLPYRVMVNSEHHRIAYCKKIVLGTWRYHIETWCDWFTDEPLENGDWIIPA